MSNPKNLGLPLKTGQLVRIDGQLYEVERDVEWNRDFQSWGSVKVVGVSHTFYTHKGHVELVSEKPLTELINSGIMPVMNETIFLKGSDLNPDVRLFVLDRAGHALALVRQWSEMKQFENAAKYTAKAEALIEAIEVLDCGSVGGFDKGQQPMYGLFPRWMWIYNKYHNVTDWNKGSAWCACDFDKLNEFFKPNKR